MSHPSLTVPRRLFVPADQRVFADDDRPLPIRYAQTISAPHIHRMTLHALRQTLARFATTTHLPDDEYHVLDVGCGSGYVVALMCEELDRWVRTLTTPPAHVRVVGIELVRDIPAQRSMVVMVKRKWLLHVYEGQSSKHNPKIP